jgi:hypothetical protein
MCAELIFEPEICVLWPYLGMRKIDKERTRQRSFGYRPVNDPENSKRRIVRRSATVAAELAAQKAEPSGPAV